MSKENIRVQLSTEDYEKVKAWTDDRESFIDVVPHATKAEIILLRCSEADVPIRIGMELYPKLAETAKKLHLTLDELIEWATLNRVLYDRRFPAITRLHHGRNTELCSMFSRREEQTSQKIQVAFEEIRRKVAAKIG